MQTGGRVRSRISDAGYPTPENKRFSATSPRTGLALGKLPTRRMCLSSVPDCVYIKVAGLGRDSLIYAGPDRSHNPIYSTIRHLSLLGFTTQSLYKSEYIANSILHHIEMSQSLYNSQFRQFIASIITTHIFLVLLAWAPETNCQTWCRLARHRSGGKHITRLPRQPNIRLLWPNTTMFIPATL